MAWLLLAAALVVLATPPGRGAVGAVVGVLVLLLAVARVLVALHPAGRGAVARGVAGCGAVVLAAVALAWWHGPLIAAVGMTALAGADAALGWSGVTRRPGPPVGAAATLLLRHAGTALIVLVVVRPDLSA